MYAMKKRNFAVSSSSQLPFIQIPDAPGDMKFDDGKKKKLSHFHNFNLLTKILIVLAALGVFANLYNLTHRCHLNRSFAPYGMESLLLAGRKGQTTPSMMNIRSELYEAFVKSKYNQKGIIVYSSFYSKSLRRKFNITSPFESNLLSKGKVSIIVLAGEIRKEHPGFHNFQKSLSFTGYNDVLILQPDDAIQEILSLTKTNQTAESLFWVKRLAQFEKISKTFQADEYLLFCDAFDVIFGLPPDILIQRFLTFERDIVFSTEMLCDTVSCRTDFHIKSWFQNQQKLQSNLSLGSPSPHSISNPYMFLNAGMFMGRAGAVQQILRCALTYAFDGRDDQTAFSMCYRDHSDVIALDYDSLLFGNIPPYDPIFNSAWTTRPWDNIDVYSEPRSRLFRAALVDSSLQRGWSQLLSVPPLLHRNHNRHQGPVALHFPGMSFRPNSDIPFNPCQQNLRWRYNDVIGIMFRDAVRPILFHPVPNRQLLPFVKREPSVFPYRVVLSVTVNSEDRGDMDSLHQFLSDFTSRQTWSVDKIYLHIILPTSQNSNTLTRRDIKAVLESIKALHTNIEISQSVENRNDVYQEMGTRCLSGLEQVLTREPDPLTMILLLSVHHSYDERLTETLVSRMIRNPAYAYGFEGNNVEVEQFDDCAPTQSSRTSSKFRVSAKTSQIMAATVASGSQLHSARVKGCVINRSRRLVRRSAAHLAFGDVVPVDTLLLREGLVVLRAFFPTQSSDKPPSLRIPSVCTAVVEEDVWLSAFLAGRGVPRIQLESAGDNRVAEELTGPATFRDPPAVFISNRNKRILVSDTPVKGIPFTGQADGSTSCFSELMGKFQNSWSADYRQQIPGEASHFSLKDSPDIKDPVIHFKELPHVWDLSGFSWQPNWDLRSATCPCTVHLMTRVVSPSLFLGLGQYLGANQTITSPSGNFLLRLQSGGRFCVYKIDHLLRCISYESISTRAHLLSSGAEGACYAAIQNGQVCVFSGGAPFFGGTKQESGHRDLLGCIPSFNRLEMAESVKLHENSTEALRKQPLAQAASADKWERLYLHITDAGLYGLFESALDPHDIQISAEERVKAFKQ